MPFQINPNVQTLNALFAIPNEQFIIPPYQRRYSWQKKQVHALFKDIDSLVINPADQDGHFFGMLLLNSPSYSVFNRLEIIDGQQRLTTITLLLKAIQKAFKSLNDLTKAASFDTFLKCSNFGDGTKLNKLVLGNMDASDYEIIMNEGNIEEIKNERLKDAINYYDQLVKELSDKGELENFCAKLIHIAVIIRLDVGSIRDAFKLFETINNRGLKLSSTDIIKNLLFGHASRMGNEQLTLVKNTWTQIIQNLDGINGNNPDIFFRRYFCSLLKKKITANGLVQEFKNYYYDNISGANLLGLFNDTVIANDDEEEEDENDIQQIEEQNIDNHAKISLVDFLNKVKVASLEYRKLTYAQYDNPNLAKEVEILNKIECSPSYIFLIQFMHLPVESIVKIKVLKLLASLMLRRHICKRQTGETDQIFAHLVKVLDKVNEPDFINSLKQQLLSKNYYPIDEEFKHNLLKYEFKGKSELRAKAILEYYNSTLGNGLNELVVAGPHHVHLEHIIPQTITTQNAINEFGDWPSYLGQDRVHLHKTYVSHIGNLTLLSATINMSISNNPFHKKRTAYTTSDILMTRDISLNEDFKFEQVEQRSELIANEVINYWRIEL